MKATLPAEMKAIALDHFGGTEVLHTETLPVPKPRAHEVILKVDTAGVGQWDPWVREGGLAEEGSVDFPYVMGTDGAGTVVAVGSSVKRLRVGDRAYAYQMDGGFYAEYARVKENHAARIPKGVDVHEAGALGADGVTALIGLQDQLELKRGESLMIIGASGGVGHLAVQLARRIGARVFAVASHRDGVELVSRLGADAAMDGRRDDVSKAARAFAPEGFDAALVLAGGDDVNGWLGAVKKDGRIAYPIGVEPEPKAPRGIEILPYNGTPSAKAFDRLNALIGEEPFHVNLGKVYDLRDVARAHRDVEKHHLGKLALRIH